eukprot:TRINITY_DN254_c0_g2_i1.p1 TRINITY_DN254_c0_g2~~TRINITY_DN254_c0_g2_i1.p1  ORF type:complete len:385 (-),score=88.01 TRINITY_DN254_c0_g2_i1:64-1218(-)
MDTKSPSQEKKEDGEILVDALSSVVNRINETYSRLAKLEKQLNLHPRSTQEYSDTVKHYDQMLPTLLTLLHAAEQSKVFPLQQQSKLLVSLWSATRQLVVLATTHKKPSEWGPYVAPVSNVISEINTIYEIEGPKAEESVAVQLQALSVLAQAFKWVIGVSPITVVVDTKNAFVKEKLTGTIAELAERIVAELSDYLETHHKCGIEWKGVRDPTHLVWDARSIVGGNLGNGLKTKHVAKEQWICEYLTKSQDYECADEQQCFVSFANQGTLNITGKAASLSLSSCSYTTVTIQDVESVEIVNCKEVKVICPTATEVHVERTAGCHIITGPTAEISTTIVTRLKVETPSETNDKELVEVTIPTGIKIKVAKGGKITTTAISNDKK